MRWRALSQERLGSVLAAGICAGIMLGTGSTAAGGSLPPREIVLPGSHYRLVDGQAQIGPGRAMPSGLMEGLVHWIAQRHDLPPTAALPDITMVPQRSLARSSDWQPGAGLDVLALYSAEDRTIFLPPTWTGATQDEIGILVHELVHHMQEAAGRRYECPQAREEAAFAAQSAWLEQFGLDLEGSVGIDPLTLLVRTHCGL